MSRNQQPANVSNGLAAVPFSQEAEEAVIGAALMNPEAFGLVSEFLKADDFYILRNGYIWEAMRRIASRKEDIDYLVVQEELENQGRLKEIGGPAYLTHLMNSTPTSIHAEVYGRLIERAAIRRRGLLMADEIKGLMLDEETSLEQIEGEVDGRIVAWRSRREDGERRLSEMVAEQQDWVEQRMKSPDSLIGLPTGFKDLDELLLGLQRTDHIIIAAAPGMGKSSLLLQIARNVAGVGGRVGIMSLEMGAEQWVQRFLALESKVDLQKVRGGQMSSQRQSGEQKSEWSRFLAATDSISALDDYLHIYDRTVNSTQIVRRARRWMMETGLDLLMIDYLQLVHPDSEWGSGKKSNRQEEVSAISRALKDAARDLSIPVVAAAQLSRGLFNRKDPTPILPDLRESGAIEQNADIVIFLHRPIYFNPEYEFPNEARLIVAKHRNGPTGTISLHFEKTTTSFSDMKHQTVDLNGSLNVLVDDLD